MNKNSLVAIVLFLYACNTSKADDAPMCYVHGGTVKPIENTDIQLYSETIDITLHSDHYSVEVNYTFINKGNAQSVTMGFPSYSKNINTSVHDFKAYENDTPLIIKTEKTDWSYEVKSGLSCQNWQNTFDQFECHTVFFKEHESKNIRNTYTGKYDPSYRDEPLTSFQYILKTGAYWKDNIHSAIVRVHADDAPPYFDLAKGCTLNGVAISLNGFVKEFVDFEPDFDLVFGVIFKEDLLPRQASSVLTPTGNAKYTVGNLIDKKSGTAWVEGVDGSGIGSTVKFNRVKQSNKRIKSIVITNGYAKNNETFINNNRVSCVKINTEYKLDTEYWDSFSDGIQENFNGKIGTKHEYFFYLKDVPTEQVLSFDCPIQANELTLEVLDVYEGLKYDDTAISEIRFVEE